MVYGGCRTANHGSASRTSSFWRPTVAKLDRCPMPEPSLNTLVEFYNANIATGLAPLRLDFSHSSHPGHLPASTESWAVTHDISVHNLPGDLVQIKACKSSRFPYYEYSRNDPSADRREDPLGMVSPILDLFAGSIWRNQISDHWEMIQKFGTLRTNNACGTHVHVSPKEGSWTLEPVK